jgi:hypothetical protein
MRVGTTELLQTLEGTLRGLDSERMLDAFRNDIFEAVTYWGHLAQEAVAENTKVNFPERAKHELDLLAKLRALVRKRSAKEQEKYGAILDTSEELLNRGKEVRPPDGGHRGVLRVIHKHFAFLTSSYKFSEADTQPTGIRFSSGAVRLKLECIESPSLLAVVALKTIMRNCSGLTIFFF